MINLIVLLAEAAVYGFTSAFAEDMGHEVAARLTKQKREKKLKRRRKQRR